MIDRTYLAWETLREHEEVNMTTYLALVGEGDDLRALPYCSTSCRLNGEPADRDRNDDRYEFEEICTHCGATIPASA